MTTVKLDELPWEPVEGTDMIYARVNLPNRYRFFQVWRHYLGWDQYAFYTPGLPNTISRLDAVDVQCMIYHHLNGAPPHDQ
jgi:hypothetical protein